MQLAYYMDYIYIFDQVVHDCLRPYLYTVVGG